MGSLNDFNYPQHSGFNSGRHSGWSSGGRPGRRLLRQCLLAAAGFCAVAILVGQEGWWGQGARYVAGPGLAAESSWLPVGAETKTQDMAAEAEAVELADTAEQAGGVAEAEVAETEAAESAIPQFTAPASGVVVSELSEDETQAGGILIQGSANQNVRATAAGTVSGVSFDEGAYRLELSHAAGFSSVYEGLSQLEVAVGDQVTLGQSVGVAAAGELNFTLLQNGTPLDPLEYLFQ